MTDGRVLSGGLDGRLVIWTGQTGSTIQRFNSPVLELVDVREFKVAVSRGRMLGGSFVFREKIARDSEHNHSLDQIQRTRGQDTCSVTLSHCDCEWRVGVHLQLTSRKRIEV